MFIFADQIINTEILALILFLSACNFSVVRVTLFQNSTQRLPFFSENRNYKLGVRVSQPLYGVF